MSLVRGRLFQHAAPEPWDAPDAPTKCFNHLVQASEQDGGFKRNELINHIYSTTDIQAKNLSCKRSSWPHFLLDGSTRLDRELFPRAKPLWMDKSDVDWLHSVHQATEAEKGCGLLGK